VVLLSIFTLLNKFQYIFTFLLDIKHKNNRIVWQEGKERKKKKTEEIKRSLNWSALDKFEISEKNSLPTFLFSLSNE